MTDADFAIASNAPVFLFSGQGTQKPGMGVDLLDIPEVAMTFSCASDIFGFDLVDLVTNAGPEKLNDTRFAQPALCALSVGIARALIARSVEPAAVLGFSLGQISALPIAGMLSDEDTFALVKVRSDLMAEAARTRPGTMSALLRADEDDIQELCEACARDEVLAPANFNCPGQIVVAGTVDAVTRIEEAWIAAGNRCSRLATSGAFHSPLMADAAVAFAGYLESVTFAHPHIPLICNVDALPLCADEACDHLVRHMISPVRFEQSVATLEKEGAHVFAEVGFGGVLTNFVKRIDKTAKRNCIQDRESFDAFVAAQGSLAAQ